MILHNDKIEQAYLIKNGRLGRNILNMLFWVGFIEKVTSCYRLEADEGKPCERLGKGCYRQKEQKEQ